MDKPQLEAFLATLDHWTAFFTALVVIGVGGEFVTHLWYSHTNEQLIAIQRTEEQGFQGQIAQLELQSEDLKNKNLELQRKMNPRFLTTTEQQIISDGISPFRGHQITIDRFGDGEAGPYGDSFASIFVKAGWAVQINRIDVYSRPTYGIVCRIAPNPDEGTKAVIAALKYR